MTMIVRWPLLISYLGVDVTEWRQKLIKREIGRSVRRSGHISEIKMIFFFNCYLKSGPYSLIKS